MTVNPSHVAMATLFHEKRPETKLNQADGTVSFKQNKENDGDDDDERERIDRER